MRLQTGRAHRAQPRATLQPPAPAAEARATGPENIRHHHLPFPLLSKERGGKEEGGGGRENG
eukprot:7443139-Pyramimonas_sp.AAC.1